MDTAAGLRQLEDAFNDAKLAASRAALARAEVAREHEVGEGIGRHFDAAQLQGLVAGMRHAAESGEHRYLALRFLSGICTDGGRSINSAQPGWPATLRGEAADIYGFWEKELHSRGFRISAEVLNFPGGKPGDVGLTFTWG